MTVREDRCADDSSGKLEFGQLEGVEGILGVAPFRLVLVDAHQPTVVKAGKTLIVATGGLLGRACAGGRNCLLLVLEVGQWLAGAHRVALLDREAADHAASTRDDGCLAVGAKSRGSRVERRDGLLRHLTGAHRDGRLLLLRAIFPWLAARAPAAALLARTFRFPATPAADGRDEEKSCQ